MSKPKQPSSTNPPSKQTLDKTLRQYQKLNESGSCMFSLFDKYQKIKMRKRLSYLTTSYSNQKKLFIQLARLELPNVNQKLIKKNTIQLMSFLPFLHKLVELNQNKQVNTVLDKVIQKLSLKNNIKQVQGELIEKISRLCIKLQLQENQSDKPNKSKNTSGQGQGQGQGQSQNMYQEIQKLQNQINGSKNKQSLKNQTNNIEVLQFIMKLNTKIKILNNQCQQKLILKINEFKQDIKDYMSEVDKNTRLLQKYLEELGRDDIIQEQKKEKEKEKEKEKNKEQNQKQHKLNEIKITNYLESLESNNKRKLKSILINKQTKPRVSFRNQYFINQIDMKKDKKQIDDKHKDEDKNKHKDKNEDNNLKQIIIPLVNQNQKQKDSIYFHHKNLVLGALYSRYPEIQETISEFKNRSNKIELKQSQEVKTVQSNTMHSSQISVVSNVVQVQNTTGFQSNSKSQKFAKLQDTNKVINVQDLEKQKNQQKNRQEIQEEKQKQKHVFKKVKTKSDKEPKSIQKLKLVQKQKQKVIEVKKQEIKQHPKQQELVDNKPLVVRSFEKQPKKQSLVSQEHAYRQSFTSSFPQQSVQYAPQEPSYQYQHQQYQQYKPQQHLVENQLVQRSSKPKPQQHLVKKQSQQNPVKQKPEQKPAKQQPQQNVIIKTQIENQNQQKPEQEQPSPQNIPQQQNNPNQNQNQSTLKRNSIKNLHQQFCKRQQLNSFMKIQNAFNFKFEMYGSQNVLVSPIFIPYFFKQMQFIMSNGQFDESFSIFHQIPSNLQKVYSNISNYQRVILYSYKSQFLISLKKIKMGRQFLLVSHIFTFNIKIPSEVLEFITKLKAQLQVPYQQKSMTLQLQNSKNAVFHYGEVILNELEKDGITFNCDVINIQNPKGFKNIVQIFINNFFQKV